MLTTCLTNRFLLLYVLVCTFIDSIWSVQCGRRNFFHTRILEFECNHENYADSTSVDNSRCKTNSLDFDLMAKPKLFFIFPTFSLRHISLYGENLYFGRINRKRTIFVNRNSMLSVIANINGYGKEFRRGRVIRL